MDTEGIDLSTINNIVRKFKKHEDIGDIYKLLDGIKRVYLNNLDDVIVSIKDIEECTKSLSQIVATAINNCIYK